MTRLVERMADALVGHIVPKVEARACAERVEICECIPTVPYTYHSWHRLCCAGFCGECYNSYTPC
jgi:hypothetical protein